MLQQVFATAVEGVYSQQQPVRADTDGDTIMFCFSAALDREAPNVVSEFVRDICAETRGDDAVCALLVVSLPEMRVRSSRCILCSPSMHCSCCCGACVRACESCCTLLYAPLQCACGQG